MRSVSFTCVGCSSLAPLTTFDLLLGFQRKVGHRKDHLSLKGRDQNNWEHTCGWVEAKKTMVTPSQMHPATVKARRGRRRRSMLGSCSDNLCASGFHLASLSAQRWMHVSVQQSKGRVGWWGRGMHVEMQAGNQYSAAQLTSHYIVTTPHLATFSPFQHLSCLKDINIFMEKYLSIDFHSGAQIYYNNKDNIPGMRKIWGQIIAYTCCDMICLRPK